MTWIILTILLAVVLAGCFVWFIGSDKGSDGRLGAIASALVAGVVWLIVTVVLSVHTVGQLQVGLGYSFSGTITGQTGHGVVWLAPWDNLQTENIGVQREDFVLDTSNSAVSSDQQEIFADLSLNYKVDPQHVLSLYKTVGPGWKAILLDSRVLQDFKEVTSTFTAEQITTKREQLRQLTKSRLTAELARYDITVVDFFVKNLSYTNSYQQAINAKNQQVQQALQAHAKVAQAQAEAAQTIATAQGQAEAIRLKGAALKDNPAVLQLEAIDKLSPNASVIICTGQTCPAFLPQATSAAPAPAAGGAAKK
jgi:regulator of protease activity HflC (stomatin/prohibitin superfamily)